MKIEDVESEILKGKYEFNMKVVESITIEEVIDGEFNVHVIGGKDRIPIDLEAGTETSSFENIPPEWLLKI